MGGYIAAFAGGLIVGCLGGIFTVCLCIVGDYKDPYLEGSEQDGDRKDSGSGEE